MSWAQVDQVDGAAGGVVFDDEPDWEGGRARERKGLKWNKASKTGFDALVRRGLMSAASMACIAIDGAECCESGWKGRDD